MECCVVAQLQGTTLTPKYSKCVYKCGLVKKGYKTMNLCSKSLVIAHIMEKNTPLNQGNML